ncbi:MAG: PSPA7_2676 family Cys-rich small protein [Pseudomonas sp.]
MTFRCIISDCIWSEGSPCRLGNEELVEQYCLRCGAHHYLSQLTGIVLCKYR